MTMQFDFGSFWITRWSSILRSRKINEANLVVETEHLVQSRRAKITIDDDGSRSGSAADRANDRASVVLPSLRSVEVTRIVPSRDLPSLSICTLKQSLRIASA